VVDEELGQGEFVMRDAVPTSDVIRIRFGDVDGLRAIAILLVAAAAILRLTTHGLPPALEALARVGSQGLALFLVLSGFTLAFPVMAVLRQDGRTYIDVGRYAIRRFLRIYPAYVVGLILTALLAPFAVKYAATGFAHVTPAGFIANLFFAGDGFGNDGFRALGMFARAYLFFPALVLLWSRKPLVFTGLIAALALIDVATPAHELAIGAFVPFMLGIVAADFRAQAHRLRRLGPVFLGAGVVLALLLDPLLRALPGARFAPHALGVDPFWSLAAFGLVVTAATYRPLEHACSFWMLRVVGASSYALSLVVVPTAALLAGLSPNFAVAIAVPVCFVVGFAYWQLVDRWFNDGDFRRNVAASAAGPIDDVLAQVRADRVFLGAAVEGDAAHDHQEEFVPDFYAPPPRPTVADLAIVSRRTGSPDELAAEILETKARLQERSAEIFGEIATPPQVYAKPGFYRKQAAESNLPFEDVEDPFESASAGKPRGHDPSPASQTPPPSPGQPGGQAIRIRITGAGDGGFNG
jgi:peptidoglycan/LPS O-acetylase OafA/YrhL